MGELLKAVNLRTYQPGGWEQPFSLIGLPGERIFIQGTHRQCSNLFELLCGLKVPNEGSVSILETDLQKLSQQDLIQFRCRHIGGVPYGGGLVSELRLIDQVTMPMYLSGMAKEEVRERIREENFRYLPVHSLYNPASRSTDRTKALTCILQAIILGQEVLIFQEPFEELSKIAADLVWQQMMNILNEDVLFLYLSSNPAPLQMPWTRKLHI